ncbi:MAG: arginine repressor [Acutalibacteraceae bacterium]
MGREARQLKILELIAKNNIDTQEELVARLRDEGFNVTQATVSRDIKDMGIIKTMASDGKKYKYAAQQPKDNTSERFLSIFRNTVLSIRTAENLVVVKTETGAANAAAETIDRMNLDCILGVIAGDNTIFIAVDRIENASYVAEKLEDILQ